MEARWLGGACVPLDGRRWLVACPKLVGTAAATSAPLFRIDVIDDGAWRVVPHGRCHAPACPAAGLLLVVCAAASLDLGAREVVR